MSTLNLNKIETKDIAMKLRDVSVEQAEQIVSQVNKINGELSQYAESKTVTGIGDAAVIVYQAAKGYIDTLKESVTKAISTSVINAGEETGSTAFVEAATELRSSYDSMEVPAYVAVECKADGAVYPDEAFAAAIQNVNNISQNFLDFIQGNRGIFEELGSSNDIYNDAFTQAYNNLGPLLSSLVEVNDLTRKNGEATLEKFTELRKKIEASAGETAENARKQATSTMASQADAVSKKLKSVENAL